MARTINDEVDGGQPPSKEWQAWWFDRDFDAFFQSLEDKKQAALLLSSELAAWFGDLQCRPLESRIGLAFMARLTF